MSLPPHSPGHHHLHVPGNSPVHRAPAGAKIVGLVVFAIGVALTPRRAVPVFALDLAAVSLVVSVSGIGTARLVRRLAVSVPFLIFAATIPFVAGGEQTTLLGASVSVEGLWAGWNVAAKTLLGACAAIVVAATTPVADLVRGLEVLRLPRPVLAIVGFMFRYLDLLSDQLRRMRTAMVARCHDPRWLWQARPIAASAGVLFVRSYERGERVHAAMLARGFSGGIPDLTPDPGETVGGDRLAWLASLVPGGLALVGAVTAMAVS